MKVCLSIADLTLMKFLRDRRYWIVMNKRQRLRSALGVSSLATAAFIFWMLILTKVGNMIFSSVSTWTFGLLSPLIYDLKCESVRFMIALFSILGDFIYCIFETKCILGSLISCGVMLSLTSFLLGT